jgi:site-specific DNA recombinase
VLFFKLDRFGRKTRVVLDAFEALDGMSVLLRSMTEPFDTTTPSGRLMFHTLANFASFERETFLERVAAGANRAAGEGRPLGGIVLYGYRVVGSKEKARWEIDDTPIWCGKSPADIARWMFELAGIERWSCYQIAAELNRLAVPTAYERDGRPTKRGTYAMAWSAGSVRNRLVNTCYRGIFTWGRKRRLKSGEAVTGDMPRLVSDELWDAAQATMKRNRKLPRSGQRRTYLLRGVIRCGTCGRNYCGVPGRTDVWWYRCSAQIKHPTFESRCSSKEIRSNWIEPVVWQDIQEWLRHPGDLLAELQGMNEATRKQPSDSGERAALEQVLRDCAGKRERIQRAYIAGDMTDAERARYLADVEGERTGALEGLSCLDVEAALDEPEMPADLLEELRRRLESGSTSPPSKNWFAFS